MADRLIVAPLDGSEFSERAVPTAVALARGMGATLAFLTIWEQEDKEIERSFPSLARDLAERAEQYYGEYLEKVARQAQGLRVEAQVKTGEPAEVIQSFATERGAQMIVMSTHGRSGLSRWWYGSVADKVFHNSTLPVVAVGPNAYREGDVTIRHIAVTLDGSPLSEAALGPAYDLAGQLGARVTLLRAVRWAAQAYPYTLPDAYVPELDAELEAGAKAYLDRAKGLLKTSAPVETAVVRGVIAEALIDFCESASVDFVVMTTHARKGVARATLGSVADRLLHGPCPALLIRPQEE